MGYLALLNDVHTILDDDGLLLGHSEVVASSLGVDQSVKIGLEIHKHLKGITHIAASDALHLGTLLHHIRSKSPNAYLTNIKVQYLESLRERGFGVLDGAYHSLESELFVHTRMCAEGGESIAQVRERVSKTCQAMGDSARNTLVISHSHTCQILSNLYLGKPHSTLTQFWLRKGAMIQFGFRRDKRRTYWDFKQAWNLLDKVSYSVDDIYSSLAV